MRPTVVCAKTERAVDCRPGLVGGPALPSSAVCEVSEETVIGDKSDTAGEREGKPMKAVSLCPMVGEVLGNPFWRDGLGEPVV